MGNLEKQGEKTGREEEASFTSSPCRQKSWLYTRAERVFLPLDKKLGHQQAHHQSLYQMVLCHTQLMVIERTDCLVD